MSWLRQVKVLYTITTLIFTYILWSIIAYLILDTKVDYKIYLISVTAVLIMMYMRNRVKNKALSNIIPSLFSAGVFILIYPFKGAVGCALYSIFMLQLFYNLEDEDIQYDTYRSRIRNSIIILIFVGLIFPFVDRNLMQQLFRFYLIYLICCVIVLREARIYANKLQNKKTLTTNIGIIMFVALASTDFVYGILVRIAKFAFDIFSFIMDKVLIVLAAVFVSPFAKLIEKIRKMLEEKGVQLDIGNKNLKKLSNDQLPEPSTLSPAVVLIIKIVLALIIIYVFYKCFLMLKPKKKKQGDAIVIQEKIQKEKIKKTKGIFSRIMDRLFKGDGGNRHKIRELYRKFEERMDDREIYKKHMTATQLSNVAKSQIEEREVLDQITHIYNEAKFSEHEIDEQMLNGMKDGYSKIKKY